MLGDCRAGETVLGDGRTGETVLDDCRAGETVLGDGRTDVEGVQEAIHRLLWFTYRRAFPPIASEAGPTTDKGWGCMYRCVQMVAGNTLLRVLGRGPWMSPEDQKKNQGCESRLVRLFLDCVPPYQPCSPEGPFTSLPDLDSLTGMLSIHELATTARQRERRVDEWVGPNSAAHALRKLCSRFPRQCPRDIPRLVVHVAMDNTLVITEAILSSLDEHSKWRPLLLCIPLRLGLSEMNPIYVPALKASLKVPQSMGIIGGRPNHALYFVGHFRDHLLFLDPHLTQPCTDDETTFHCDSPGALPFAQLDPSLALCFCCLSEEELRSVGRALQSVILDSESKPLVHVVETPPPESSWLPPQEERTGEGSAVSSLDAFDFVEGAESEGTSHSDQLADDDEFVIIE
ncbi:unnamed protein product [Cyprideis torosa]|uniref:Cysteine protease n=1 Tax=Cyprideis torosa TaxID=163714 RepID=A0A7R8WGB1_9CRUS|nr:unnamed protein product [Cyprideis torosa]CAG0896395.1 unnamed protein product [Cyprideis torosa]